jgi:hypothetical protein
MRGVQKSNTNCINYGVRFVAFEEVPRTGAAETIAALAMRLREAVRRLSQEWEAAQGGSAEVK